jgi:hypothetical protein
MKKQTHLSILPLPPPLSNPLFPQTVTIAIAIAIHPDDRRRCMWPALSPPEQPMAAAAVVAASLNDPMNIWQWLRANHPCQLALLDNFEVELWLG